MNLTRQQLATLEAYSRWRKNPPSYFALLASQWKRLLALAIICAAAAYVLQELGAEHAWLIMFAFGVGVLSNTSAYIRAMLAAWPAIERVLDWEHIDRAIADGRVD